MNERIPAFKAAPIATDIAAEVMAEHYTELRNADVNIVWVTTHKPMASKGKPLHCKILKQSEIARFLMMREDVDPADLVIVLPLLEWHDADERHRRAMVDFALCHLDVSLNLDGEPRREADGRPKVSIRREDFSGFKEIVARHGFWDEELEDARETLVTAGKQGRLKTGPATADTPRTARKCADLMDAVGDFVAGIGEGTKVSMAGPDGKYTDPVGADDAPKFHTAAREIRAGAKG